MIIRNRLLYRLYLYIKIVICTNNPSSIIYNRFKIIKESEYLVKFRSGERFICRANSNDINEAAVIMCTDEYPSNVLRHLPDNSHILDIGAHIGSFSIKLSKLRPDLHIHAFEPSVMNYKQLKKNIKINNCKNIITYNCAISDYDGHGTFDVSSDYDGFCLNDEINLKQIDKETVKVCRLSTVMSQVGIGSCSLIKMDVEGSEEKILMDSGDILKNRCNRIIFEYHKHVNLVGLIDYLSSLGYSSRFGQNKIIISQKNV